MSRKRNILFLSYWSLREPLTAAAVFPYLRLLAQRPEIENLHLVTVETTPDEHLPSVELDMPKVTVHKIKPPFTRPYFIAKVCLQFYAVLQLIRLISRNRIDLIFAKASMAGALAYLAHLWTRTPYIVESFEPHSLYMVECGIWKRNDIRFLFASALESCQLRTAEHVMTVTHNHRQDLLDKGWNPSRIHVIPSITDLEAFKPDPNARATIRDQLKMPGNATVGVYVGKFGGLYLDEEAFQLFARSAHEFAPFHLIILSPSDPASIREKARATGMDERSVHVLTVPHVEVPNYLSAADFAFSTIRPTPIKRYQCPIKNGEYWASGLPILTTEGISDEDKDLRIGSGGSTYRTDLTDIDTAFARIRAILKDPEHRVKMIALAKKYRSIDIAKQVYEQIL
jgi:glycosyltransferase involved in cell wall biosynthesis